jgi:AAA15 family ATPase/GTPase
MLIEFTVENFRSIKNEITFSLVASSDNSLDKNLIEKKTLKKDRLLKSAVIYGANASGKSNVLLAFGFLKRFVVSSHEYQKGNKIRFEPFMLDKKCLKKPTKFEIVFIKNDIKYIYGLSYTSEKVIEEYLYYYPSGRKALIFERKKTNHYNFTIDEKEQKFISERTLDNVLYLSSSTKLNYKKTSEAFEWFLENLKIIGPGDHPSLMDFTVDLVKQNEELKKIILKALTEADVGISDVFSTSKIIEFEDLSPELKARIEAGSQQQKIDIEKIEGVSIQTVHKILEKDGNESQVIFNINQESEGTKRMLSLIGPWIDALKNGRILIADELDTKLHHLLNVFLIKLFQDPTQNKTNAQLIFSTHNTNLLDQELFRRDQIWFTEKNPEKHCTELYSLLEFKPRKDKNIQKGYLAGRYGALPFIRDEKVF